MSSYTISDEERQRRSERMRQMRADRQNKPPAANSAALIQSLNGYQRFGLADFEDMGPWLLSRLVERWPHLKEATFFGWLRGLMLSNEFLFLRTANAVLLAQLQFDPLEPQPFVEELFVLVRGDAYEEGGQLYAAMKAWCAAIGAHHAVVERFSDVPRELIAKGIGKVHDVEYSVVRL